MLDLMIAAVETRFPDVIAAIFSVASIIVAFAVVVGPIALILKLISRPDYGPQLYEMERQEASDRMDRRIRNYRRRSGRW